MIKDLKEKYEQLKQESMTRTDIDNRKKGEVIYASPKIMKRLLIGSLVFLLIISSYLIYELYETKDYVEVKGQITHIRTQRFKNTTEYSFTIKYEYNGIQYTSKQTTSNQIIKKEKGDIIQIFCNPNNPEQIRDISKGIYILIFILIAFSIFDFLAYRQAKATYSIQYPIFI